MGQAPARAVQSAGTSTPAARAYPPTADSFETLWKKHSARSLTSGKAVLTRTNAAKLLEDGMAPLGAAISRQEISQALAKSDNELDYEMTLSLLTMLQSASTITTQAGKRMNISLSATIIAQMHTSGLFLAKIAITHR